MRQFHHAPIAYNVKSGVKSPKDLEGKKVGVRAYTVTTGVWGRAALAESGLDLDSVTWVLSGDEHVAEYRPPANVVPIEPGQKMADMLASGALAAAIGIEVDHPDVKPLIPNALEAGLAALRGRGRSFCPLERREPGLDDGDRLPSTHRAPAKRRVSPSRVAHA